MSQDVNSDWQNRTFVEGIEMAMRKCIDFLSDFHEQAKFRLSEVDQRLTSLERKVDFVEAQLANADPTQRNAKTKSFEGSTFDPQVRREQVKKFRERLHKTEKVFSDRVIAPRKEHGKGGKLIVNNTKKAASPTTEIIGAPKIQGKGNIPIKQLQKQQSQQSESKEMESSKPKPKPIAVGGPGGPGGPGGAGPGKGPGNPPQPKSPPKQPGGGPGGPPGQGGPGSPNRPPPSAAQAQAAMAAQAQGKKGGPGAGPGGPPAVPQPPGPPVAVPQPPKPQQQPPKQPPVPKPPMQPGSGSGSGEGEGTYPADGGGDGFPHGDPNSIDLLIMKPGNGNVPGGKSKVEIKYLGFLADGSKFIEHQEVISLGLKQNIKGLEAGVQRMQEGTFAKLWIPSKLGYGVRGAPPLIPENADLTFEITLLRIVE